MGLHFPVAEDLGVHTFLGFLSLSGLKTLVKLLDSENQTVNVVVRLLKVPDVIS